MADIVQLNNPLVNIMKALGQGGTNFLGAKTGMEDRRRAQEQEDLKTFIALMPYLNGGGAGSVGPNGELFPAAPMQAPKNIQNIVSKMTGMENPIFGPSAAMRKDNAGAYVAEATSGNTVKQSGQAVALGDKAITSAEIQNQAGQYGVDTTPIKDKQVYIKNEAPNYVANAITPELPATDKNRQKLIQQAYKAFNMGAPDTLYKKSVRPDDFAGAVDAAIMAEKNLAMERARVSAYARQVSASGTPDYLKAASEMRMTLNNRLQDMKSDKNLMNIVTLQESGQVTDENALPPEILSKYRVYKGLLQQSDALMRVQSDIMSNGGVPSKEGMKLLSAALSATGADASTDSGIGASGGSGMDAAVSQFTDAIRSLPEVARMAKLKAAKAEGLLTDEQIRAINKALSGGKK